ncbi:MAG: hypothetical protein ACFFCQ_08250 [Promethearchaeota archaeon]
MRRVSLTIILLLLLNFISVILLSGAQMEPEHKNISVSYFNSQVEVNSGSLLNTQNISHFNSLSHDFHSFSFDSIIESIVQDNGGNYLRSTAEITNELLSVYNLLILHIPVGGISQNMTASEITAIKTWISNGGRLILTGSDLWTEGDSRLANINAILGGSGIKIEFSLIKDPTNYTGVASPVDATPIFSQGNTNLGWIDGFQLPSTYTNCITVTGAIAIVWGDEDSFAISPPSSDIIIYDVGSHPITAAYNEVGDGKIAVLTNFPVLPDWGYSGINNYTEFSKNILEILATTSSYVTSSSTTSTTSSMTSSSTTSTTSTIPSMNFLMFLLAMLTIITMKKGKQKIK